MCYNPNKISTYNMEERLVKLKDLIRKYKHGWVFSYFLVYIIWFFTLENTVTNYKTIKIWLDDYIPFNEWFVIPYYLWFTYIAVTVLYFFLTNKEDFYKCVSFLFIGMTICLIIYTIWPNGQHLRPDLSQIPRDNIFIRVVSRLYAFDTPTNVCPSIHVFNSIGAHIAIHKSKALKKHKWIQWSSFILMILICLSTMFLKQHSAFDVIAGIALSGVMYIFVYVLGSNKATNKEADKVYTHSTFSEN